MNDFELALNLIDLDRLSPDMRSRLLAGRLARQPIKISDKPQDAAVGFSCPLLMAAAICDRIWSEERKEGDRLTTIYLKKQGRWSKLSPDAVLTKVVDGEMILDPRIFPPAGPAIPLQASKVRIGKTATKRKE